MLSTLTDLGEVSCTVNTRALFLVLKNVRVYSIALHQGEFGADAALLEGLRVQDKLCHSLWDHGPWPLPASVFSSVTTSQLCHMGIVRIEYKSKGCFKSS